MVGRGSSYADAAAAPAFVVVGGGLAGWLAALALHDLSRTRWGAKGHAVRVVQAPSIPPLGVGESSTGLFAAFLQGHGISPGEFARASRATFKLGLDLSGWAGPGHRYLSPIDNPDAMAGIPAAAATSISQRCAVADGCPLDLAHLHGHLMRRGRVPAIRDGGDADLLGTHSWHFDAARAAALVERTALQRGVRLVLGHVAALERCADGSIEALRLADGRSVSGTFFVDCSGQKRLFMDPARPDWNSQSELVLVDRAVTGSMPHRASLPVATRAVAAREGWMWEIPTRDRLGVGYVHSGAAVDLDRAHETLERHAGPGFVAGPTLRFEPGYRRRPWSRNGVAVGMASGFCEPLQSTSLHLALMQIDWIVRAVGCPAAGADGWTGEAESFNRFMTAFQQDLGEFIALHYAGGAFPSAFWASAGDAARSTQLFRSAFADAARWPADRALQGRSGGISPNLVLPTAAGLGLLSAPSAAAAATEGQRRTAARARALHRLYAAQALGHRAALELVAPEPGNGEAALSPDRINVEAPEKELFHEAGR